MCNICKISKELTSEYFHKAKTKLGFDTTCKACRNLKHKMYWEDNRRDNEQVKASRSVYNSEYRNRPEVKEARIISDREYIKQPDIRLRRSEYGKLYRLSNRPDKADKDNKRLSRSIEILESLGYKLNDLKFKSYDDLLSQGLRPSIVYINKHYNIVNSEYFIKIGFTTLSVEERYRGYKGFPYEVLKIIPFKTSGDAIAYERYLLNLTRPYVYTFYNAKLFVGFTECRTMDSLSVLI
jgi:hypothetical protein